MYSAKLLLVAQAVAGGEVKKSKYVKTFAATDWTAGGTYDTLEIKESEHKRGKDPMTDIYYLSGSTYIKPFGTPQDAQTVNVDSSGNITLSVETGNGYAGKLVVL